MKYYLWLAVALLLNVSAMAQNMTDALRYSRRFDVGTARFNAMGGAFGALGGDPSVITSNPAGLAIFKRSEVSFTPSVFNQRYESNYLNSTSNDNKSNFNFNHLSYTSVDRKNNTSGWLSSTWQASYNRINNFHGNRLFQGANNQTSALDGYLYELDQNLIPVEEIASQASLPTFLAWEAFLIDTILVNNGANYQYIVNLDSYDAFQRKVIETDGSQGSFNLAYSGNYNNHILLGASITIHNTSYSQKSVFTESYPAQDTLNSFSIVEEFDNTGTGIGAILGMIYRINDLYRVGFSVHTPITYSISESYQSRVTGNFKGGLTTRATSGIFDSDYTVRTPWRFQLSGASIINKKGLISIEYELVDYTNVRLESSDFSFDSENAAIKRVLKLAHNVKAGAEYRYNQFAIRGGYRFDMNPYVTDFEMNSSNLHTISLGGGYRTSKIYADLAWVYTQGERDEYLYDPLFSEPSKSTYANSRISVSVGFRWL